MKKNEPAHQPPPRSTPGWLPAAIVLALLMALLPAAVISMPDRVAIPVGEDNDEGPVHFSHWAHSTYQCYACHPTTFPQRPLTFTHDDMDEGRYCGACHDGRTAWLVEDGDCQQCHQ